MYILLITFITGIIIGSFLNVLIYRLPRGESIVFPSSHCPHCKKPVKFYDNIPVLSYIILRGRCRHCGHPISIQYPLVELANGAGYVILVWRFGPTPETLLYAFLFSALLVVSVIDLHHKIIPDVITIPGIIIGIGGSIFFLPTGIKDSFIGILLGGGLFFLVAVISRGGMGGGDIKLIAMIGAFLGWTDVIITIVLSSFLGSLVGICLMIFFGKGRKYPVPFGPFLSIGGIITLFFSQDIIRWYLG